MPSADFMKRFKKAVADEKPAEKDEVSAPVLQSNNKKVDELGHVKSSCLKSRPAMRTEEFNLEKEDELAMGSCFETNRCDELNHSVIHFTKSSHNGLQRTTQILKTIEKPTAIESFESMDLIRPLFETLVLRYPEGPTAIQALAIPSIMENGCDFVIRAPTGSGKTASFLVPIINQIELEKQQLLKREEHVDLRTNYVYAIIICPGRDLAMQLYKEANELAKNTKVNVAFAIGEISMKNSLNALGRGADILVGTLGRLDHFLVKENILNLERLMYFVADETDSLERLDGFVELYENVRSQPKHSKLQTILSSATLGFESALDLENPVHIMVKDDMPPPTLVHGFVNLADIPKKILNDPNLSDKQVSKFCYLITFFMQHVRSTDGEGFKRLPKTIVYVNGKRKADALAIQVIRHGFKAFSFHGDKNMDQRTDSLKRMKNDDIDVLIATNVLARGLNMNIEYVINFDLPVSQTNYVEFVHRVGRTARVGNYGIAITFFDPFTDSGFAPYLKKMLTYYKMEVPEFIGDVIRTYIENAIKKQDAYFSRMVSQSSNSTMIPNQSSYSSAPMSFA